MTLISKVVLVELIIFGGLLEDVGLTERIGTISLIKKNDSVKTCHNDTEKTSAIPSQQLPPQQSRKTHKAPVAKTPDNITFCSLGNCNLQTMRIGSPNITISVRIFGTATAT